MSGEESLAQVYREIEHPKLRNLEKAGFVIFIYSLSFTAGVSFLAAVIIPDDTRKNFLDNLIGGLAMYLQEPYTLRLVFHLFVVLVGVLILASGRQQIDEVRSGASYASQKDLRVHFGLGKATQAERLEIRWPSGQVDVLENVAADQLIYVEEGKGIVKRISFPPK
jgi:hypothetical protein